MADTGITLTPTPALRPEPQEIGGTSLAALQDVGLLSVAIPQEGDAALSQALKRSLGLQMPGPRTTTKSGGTRALRLAPDLLLLLCSGGSGITAKALSGVGYLTDQTDAWVVLEIDGPTAEAALARICPIDLHPSVFPEDAAARTVMEHMGAIVIRTGANRFHLLSARSSARSFLHAVETSLANVAP